MGFPSSFPVSIWVMMGTLGTICSILFTVLIYRWVRSGQKFPRSVPYSNYSILGYMFLFASGLICCGIAGPPGYALSSDPNLVSKEWILRASGLSNFLAVLGWTFAVIGQRNTLRKNARLVNKAKRKRIHSEEILESTTV